MTEKSSRTVSELAKTVGISAERMLAQLQQSGLSYTDPGQQVSEEDRQRLLASLRNRHGTDNKTLSLAKGRRKVSVKEVRIASSQGQRKVVTVEVRNRVRGAGSSPVKETINTVDAKLALAEEARRQRQDHADALRVESEKTERKLLLSKVEALKNPKPVEQPQASKRSQSAAQPSSPVAPKAEPTVHVGAEPEAIRAKPDSSSVSQEASSPIKPPPKASAAADKTATTPSIHNTPSRASSEACRKTAAGTTAAKAGNKPPAKAGNKPPAKAGNKPPAKAGNKPPAAGRSSEGRRRTTGGGGGHSSKRKQLARSELHVAGKPNSRLRRQVKNKALITNQPARHAFEMPTAPVVRKIFIPEAIVVADLAQKMSIKESDLIKKMINMGIMASINQIIDQETAQLIVEDLGHQALLTKEGAIEETIIQSSEVEDREMILCAPVVTIMGHANHGKTSLLDYIRQSTVVDTEAGGITQRIGAYRVNTSCGAVTFIDTPGHAAFTAMRARGSKVTDIIVLVVSADDGVMPQTVEAITHAQSANVPIIVVVSKCDLEGVDPQRIRQDLTQHNVFSEDIGGDTMFVHISAKTGEGIEHLLETIAVQAEVLELKAPDSGIASGVILESRLDVGCGTVATVLVQRGLLKRGDMLLAGQAYGRVRCLYNENKFEVAQAGPSMPVEVWGLSQPPKAGDAAIVVKDGRRVREAVEYRQMNQRRERLAHQQATRLSNIFERIGQNKDSQGNQVVSLNIIIKADMQGSIDALSGSLEQLSTEEVKVKIVSAAVGGINETDVNLALSADAILVGFNVRADIQARKLMTAENITPYYHSIIYHLIDAIERAIEGKSSPKFEDQMRGTAEVLEVFRSKRLGNIAGCRVIEGVVKHRLPIRVLRDSVVIYEGELESLRHFQDNVTEVSVGTECGIGVRNYNDIKVNDQIEVFERVAVKRP